MMGLEQRRIQHKIGAKVDRVQVWLIEVEGKHHLSILHLGGGALVPAVKSKVLLYMYPLRNQDPAPSLHYCLFKIFFLMWTIFKVFIEFDIILFLLYVLVFLPPGMWDLSTPTRDQT